MDAQIPEALIFGWRFWPKGEARPFCASSNNGEGPADPLSCLLTDDGGLGLQHAADWISEAIALSDRVTGGELDVAEWNREDWGARLSGDMVKVYSLHDEDCSATLTTSAFRRILIAWQEFIQRLPTESDAIKILV